MRLWLDRPRSKASRLPAEMAKRRKSSADIAVPEASRIEPEPAARAARAPAAYAPVVDAGFRATASRVQEMHEAISGKTFDSLLRVPGLSVPTRMVQSVHDAITQGVYAAVRHGGGAAMFLAGAAERHASDPSRVPGPKEQSARSALSGVFGDSLAVQMNLHVHGVPLPPLPSSATLPSLRSRVCVFLHGLACDEQSWALRTDAWNESVWADALPPGEPFSYGALLEHEIAVSAIHLRYNTGVSIENNAEQFAALMERTARAFPRVEEWTLIGHSMGGLIARRAHQVAQVLGMTWQARVPMIICLGSPSQGAPLEQLGHLATRALNAAKVTQPLGRIVNARSAGIKDLRRGLKGMSGTQISTAAPALRLVFATLGDESGAGFGALIGQVLGDGLVMAGSASDEGATGDVQRVEVAGLGHMGLLNHPRVYAVIRRWLGVPDGA
jgi:pimeloyl-ACP methyl ester carboxylesterase